MSRPALSFAAVLVVVAAGTALATAAQPEAARTGQVADPVRATVARAGAVCPDPVSGHGLQSRVDLAAPGVIGAEDRPDRPAAGPAGRAWLADLGGGTRPRAELTAPSSANVVLPDKSPAQVVTATGAAAPGLAATMVTRAGSADMRGLAGTRCAAADTDFWFVGSGAVIGQRGRLYLTNPEPAPALVDVTLFGPDGPIDAPGGREVAVAAGAQEVLLLDALSPETPRFGVHVQARQGRVAAALRDQQAAGLAQRGVDWVPAAAAPGRRVLIPGVPGGPGERALQVLVPGDSDAIARLRLVTDEGAFAPTGLDVVEARAGEVTNVDLAPYTNGQRVAVELVSDVPVAAGLLARVGGQGGDLEELAYTAATAPLTPSRPGVVPQAGSRGAGRSSIVLAAPKGPATVELGPVPPGTGSPVRVHVPAGAQRLVDLGQLSDERAFAVTVVPLAGSGPVVAAQQVREPAQRGDLLTVIPVPPGRYAVRVPPVSPDLSTGLRPAG